ncbi:hypothetical protein KIN20_016882 [Parelaphostrongylus tenuis]|uniref:Metaxin glutathione S-transferase domain-containing protein n=1 Tax=Parelaphostrongylus tenuis TaxID=148309 RepID=A0AAD5N5U7_PARTN|nr:hypothetical protein KIN20_016882 [Parelaphostrongylus tenuis]
MAQGIAKNTPEEVAMIAEKDLDAISTFLGNKKYFFGDKPTTSRNKEQHCQIRPNIQLNLLPHFVAILNLSSWFYDEDKRFASKLQRYISTRWQICNFLMTLHYTGFDSMPLRSLISQEKVTLDN